MTFDYLQSDLDHLPAHRLYGRVTSVLGMLVEVGGMHGAISVGGRCQIAARDGRRVLGEVVGFRSGQALVMPFGTLEGVGLGCKAEVADAAPAAHPDPSWLGRVVNALGEPVDGGPPLPKGRDAYPLRAAPPPAHQRRRVGEKIDLGVRGINTFLTCCRGQRMGVFSGSGIGKSILLAMFARYTEADVNVIGLIGERGREVQEFLEDYLGPEGRARSVVVVATSDEPPLMRRQAAYMTLTLAEYFCGQGKEVLCMMDSVTRFAMAQREIGLTAGEPPATKGYPPTVFGELPKLLERAGPGTESQGNITGLFTVLVEGDDHTEPLSDAVRGILDGHIVLGRAIAERGRFPAVDLLRSVSRTMPDCNSEAETALVTRARRLISRYEDMEELIRIGAYREGSNPDVDEAIRLYPGLEAFLAQNKDEHCSLADGYDQLHRVLENPAGPGADAEPTPDAAGVAGPEAQ